MKLVFGIIIGVVAAILLILVGMGFMVSLLFAEYLEELNRK